MLRRTFYLPLLAALVSCSAGRSGSPSGPAADAAPGADVASAGPGAAADAPVEAEADGLTDPQPDSLPDVAPDMVVAQMGDGWCHAKCMQGGTCADGLSCVTETLCNGSDYCPVGLHEARQHETEDPDVVGAGGHERPQELAVEVVCRSFAVPLFLRKIEDQPELAGTPITEMWPTL